MNFFVIYIVFLFLVLLGSLIFWIQCFKRCPSDYILVIYGKTQEDTAIRCVHNGAAFVWPILQDFGWLDLKPIPIDFGKMEFSPDGNGRITISSKSIVGISTQSGIMENAAKRLLGLNRDSIRDLTLQIAQASMNSLVREMDLGKIKADPNSFADGFAEQLQRALVEIGLEVIELNLEKIEVSLPEAFSLVDGVPEIGFGHPPAKEEPT